MASATEGGDKPAQTTRKVLTQEERDNLLVHHIAALRGKTQAVEKAREPLTEAQAELTSSFNLAKADLGKNYSRKYLSGLIADSMARGRDLAAEEQRRAHDKAVLGQPVFGMNDAGQFDMFTGGGDAMPQEAKDEIAWEAEGYLLGRRAGDREAPEGCPTRFAPAVLRGYDRGQDENGRRFVAAQAVIDKRGQPDPDAAPKDLNTPEPTTAETKAAERKSVAKARASLEAIGGEPANKQAA